MQTQGTRMASRILITLLLANTLALAFNSAHAVNHYPYKPSNPSPFDGESGVSITPVLSWTGGDPDPGDTVTYDVYLGLSLIPGFIRYGCSEPLYSPLTLKLASTYYWQVDAVDDYGYTGAGPFWSFQTEPAHIGTIFIKVDGSIDPPTAPIQRNGNYYTLTGNIFGDTDGIVIQKSNITVDGAGYHLQANGTYSKGFSLNGINNVTIKNTDISNCNYGIWLDSSSNNSVSSNSFSHNGYGIALYSSNHNSILCNTIDTNAYVGIWVYSSSSYNTISNNSIGNNRYSGGVELYPGTLNNTISDNDIKQCYYGIKLTSSSYNKILDNNLANNREGGIQLSSYSRYNTISGNNITDNPHGIELTSYSSYNIVLGNNITANSYGIWLQTSSSNSIYHNSFANIHQVYSTSAVNVWDYGVFSGGNYWSDYTARYPDAEELDDSGIWNTPYVIDGNNQDNYPLLNPLTLILEPKFRIGDWVQTMANLNVREGPGLGYTIIDTMSLGAVGQVVGGPVEADDFVWWNVSYNVGVRGWSAENWLELHMSEAPTCVVELQQGGVEISEVGVWEFFDIYVGDSTGDTGIKQVHFSSDNVQDGYPTGEWTDWFDWTISSEDWYATTKTKHWAFDTPGYKEVWAEVKDETDLTSVDLATIFVPAPALPVLTSPLVITPMKDIYNEGDSLEAEFTIKNIGDIPITLDVLTVGGRLNGFIPSEGAPDFTFQSVTLQPDESYQYQGSLTLTQIGSYNFFIAYRIENPTPDEKRLLDENNWNTWTELGEGLTHNDRVKNIIVFEEGTVPEDLLQLGRKIDRLKNYHSQYQCPTNLLDANSFEGKVSKVWMSFKSFLYSTDLVRQYREQYSTGVNYERLASKAVLDAEHFLETGNIEGARRSLTESLQQSILSGKSIAAAAELVDRHMELAEKLARYVKNTCEVVVRFGVKIVYPPAAPIVDGIYMGINAYITTKLEGVEQAKKDFATELLVTLLLNNVKFASLDDDILVDYVNKVAKKASLDTLFAMDDFMLEFGYELREVIEYRIKDELGSTISGKLLENADHIIDYVKSLISSYREKVECPVELRVLDFRGQTTGLVNGTVRHEIPMSMYCNGTVTVFFPDGSYPCEVAGTDEGVYDLEVTSVKEGNATAFNATGIPTSPNTIHQYTVDWDALSASGEGVTVLVDVEGDGVVDRIFSSDNELTGEEFLEKTSPTYPTYALTIIASEGGTAFPTVGTYACSANSTVQVTAIPGEGYVLDYWELGNVNAGSNNPYTVLMQENHTLNAVFRLGISDIAVTNVSPSKTVVGQGYSLSINVTAANQGDFPETFNITLYADTIAIETREITLEGGVSTTIAFTWNTTSYAKGNYAISAYAEPVLGETYTADNTYNYGLVKVTILGDTNGDQTVNVLDLILIANHLDHTDGDGHTPFTPDWYKCMNADLNNDGQHNVLDLILCANHLGQHW